MRLMSTGAAIGAIAAITFSWSLVLADGAFDAQLKGVGSTATTLSAMPSTSTIGSGDDLIAKVRGAIAGHDIDFFENHLVDWDGARKRTQRLTLYQIRECFGRPVKTIALEPLTPDPAAPLVPDGYRTNLPVTHLLRVTFDEKHAPQETPACVFMMSKDPNASYRMVLVLPTTPPPK